jgi:RNA-directed DNA polymerase
MNQTEKLRYKYEWSTINWKSVEMTVFKLQKRIYRASQCGNIPMVRRLQRLLLASRSSKLLSVRKVTQDNTGNKTPGVDGKIILKDEQRMELVNKLNLTDTVMPIRRVWIDKPGKKEKRPLGIPTIRDRVNQALVKLALEPEWEARFEPNSYGFRPGRSTHDAIEAIFSAIHLKQAYVLDADITGCFNNIDHKALIIKINTSPKLSRIIQAWIRAGIMEHGIVSPNLAGTQQGGIISPLLANIALHGLEYDTKESLTEDLVRFTKTKTRFADRKLSQKRISIIRYADDFVVIHEVKDIVMKARTYITEWLRKIGLVLNETKTRLCHTYRSLNDNRPGFKFLGFEIRQYKSPSSRQGFKTLIKPHSDSVKTHEYKLKQISKKLVGESQETLIRNLNPIIRGWSNYNRYSVARKVFEVADDNLFWTLWA